MLIVSRIHSASWEGKALLILFDDNTMHGSLSGQYPFICLGEKAFRQVLFAAEPSHAEGALREVPAKSTLTKFKFPMFLRTLLSCYYLLQCSIFRGARHQSIFTCISST